MVQGSAVFGKSSSVDVTIDNTYVSRRHFQVRCQDDVFFISDLDSTNGTYINGVKIKRCILRNNDQITVGDITITFLEERTREQ